MLVLLLLLLTFWTVSAGGGQEECPMGSGDSCCDRYFSAALELAVKLALANDGHCHLTLPLGNNFFVMGSKQAEIFIASKLPVPILARILPQVPSIKQVVLDYGKMMFWDSENSNHTIKLKIYTVEGITRKVHVLVENKEFQLPEDQTSFNELLRKYPGLIYSLFKTFSEHSIPFVFDEITGELRLLINDDLTFQTVTLAIDGKNYSLPAQWKDIENDTRNGLIVEPGKVIQLLNEHNVTIPSPVLEVLRSYIRHPVPTVIRRRHTLQLRIKGRAGRLTYLLTLADGRRLTLPSQWDQLQTLVDQGQIRLDKVLELLGKKSARIGVEKESRDSVVFRINGELWELRKNPRWNET